MLLNFSSWVYFRDLCLKVNISNLIHIIKTQVPQEVRSCCFLHMLMNKYYGLLVLLNQLLHLCYFQDRVHCV